MLYSNIQCNNMRFLYEHASTTNVPIGFSSQNMSSYNVSRQ